MSDERKKIGLKYGTMLFILSYSILYYLIGEQLPVHNGLGWDGLVYAAYAKDFIQEITTNSDAYHVSRCFPSLLIWICSKLLNYSLVTPAAIISAFYVFNTVCFLLIAVIWFKLCKLKNFSFTTQLFGAISFFCNFVFLKYYPYIPVLTDVFALLLGMSSLYCCLKKSVMGLCLLLLPTMLTWPIGIVFIFIFLLFDKPPRNINLLIAPNSSLPPCLNPLLNFAKSNAVKLASCVAFVYAILLLALSRLEYTKHLYQLADTTIATNLAPISAILAGFYVFIVAKSMQTWLLFRGLRCFNAKNMVIYFFFLFITLIIYNRLLHLSPNHGHEASATSPETIFRFLLFYIPTSPLIKPGLFFTMQVVNWGPAAILFIFLCKEMFQKAYSENTALALLLLISFYFSLNAQYRFNIFLMPLMIYLLCLVIQDLKIDLKCCLSYFLIAIFSSKIYLLINRGVIPNNPTVDDLYYTTLQKLFMNTGYWVSWEGYGITCLITIMTGLLLYNRAQVLLRLRHVKF